MKTAGIAVTLALLCTVVASKAAEPSRSITLEGMLVAGEFYGPPNYGEDPRGDRIEHSLFLQLPATPATQLSHSEALAPFGQDAGSTYFVQVVIHDPQRFAAENAVGHRVQVIGVPFAPLTGHHRTPLLIDVKSLKPIDTWRW